MSKKILFAHGWATDHKVFEQVIEGFKKGKEGYDCINPDIPGHGCDGERNPWGEPNLNSAVDKYLKILQGNNVTEEAADIIGIGWSLGAQILMRIELKRPGTFKGLVLIGATARAVSKEGYPFGHQRALVKRMMIDLKKEPRETLERFYSLIFTDFELGEADPLALLYRLNSPERNLDMESLSNALEAHYNTDIIDDLRSLDLPVLIIHGTEDQVAPIAAGRFLAKKIKGAKLEIFKNSGHAPFINESREFLRITNDFLDAILL